MARFRSALLAIAALGFGTPAAAEVTETKADGFVTRDTIVVATGPLETWLALTKPGEWWSDNHTWSGDATNMTIIPQAGGCFCERLPGADGAGGFELAGSVQHAVVIQAYPLKMLRLRGGLGPLQGEPATGVLTMTLEEIDGGTRVLWEYNVGGSMRYEPAEIAPAVDKVLTEQLHRLRDHLGALEGAAGPADEEPADDTGGEGEPSIEAQIDALKDQETN